MVSMDAGKRRVVVGKEEEEARRGGKRRRPEEGRKWKWRWEEGGGDERAQGRREKGHVSTAKGDKERNRP